MLVSFMTPGTPWCWAPTIPQSKPHRKFCRQALDAVALCCNHSDAPSDAFLPLPLIHGHTLVDWIAATNVSRSPYTVLPLDLHVVFVLWDFNF